MNVREVLLRVISMMDNLVKRTRENSPCHCDESVLLLMHRLFPFEQIVINYVDFLFHLTNSIIEKICSCELNTLLSLFLKRQRIFCVVR